jgi:hypothetical protein
LLALLGFEQANVDTNDLKARSEEFRKGLTANQLKKLESKMKKAGLLESFSGEKYSPSKTTMKAIRALHRAGRFAPRRTLQFNHNCSLWYCHYRVLGYLLMTSTSFSCP